MADIAFLLLIFFLVATRFEEIERQLPIVLPSANEALPAIAQPNEIVINISDDGRYFIEGKFRLPERVEEILRRAVTNNPLNHLVVIRADRAADCQAFITVIDLCKKVGIENYTAVIDEQ